MTGVAVPLLLALLQLDEMDILEHEPIEQHEALEEEELDDIDPDTDNDVVGADDPTAADVSGDEAEELPVEDPDDPDWEDIVEELEEKLEEAGLKRLRSLLMGLETPSLL